MHKGKIISERNTYQLLPPGHRAPGISLKRSLLKLADSTSVQPLSQGSL